MRMTAWMLAGALALPFGAARAADDDAAPPDPGAWARWQGRVSLGAASSRGRPGADTALGARAGSATVMGDYYFHPSFDGARLQGGFRATSGLVLGSRAWLGNGSASLATGAGRPWGPSTLPGLGDASGDSGTQPYLGLGYSSLSSHSGFSFSADLGLLARGNAAGGGRALASQNLDDAVRQLRMTPLLQLGASYSF